MTAKKQPTEMNETNAPAIALPEVTLATITEVKPKGTRKKEGENKVQVTLSDADYADLKATADGRNLNIWLSKLLDDNVAKIAEEYNDRGK